jgi:PPOX class probable F420-dependent enzyme
MSPEQVRAFVTATPARTGKLATVRADGRAHVAPVWIDLDEDDAIVWTTGAGTVKGQNLTRSGRASLCIDDEVPPFSFVTFEGPVALSDDLEEVRYWATRIAGRYMGIDRADEYGRRNGVPGELVARLTPEHVVSAADLAN